MDATDAAIFGRSLLLEDGDLVLRDGDLVGVAGRDNLDQGLRVALATPYGSDPFHARYGFDGPAALAAGAAPGVTRELLRLSLVRAVGGDDRVREVAEVVFDDDPRFFELVPTTGDPADAGPAGHAGRRWRMAALLELADGGRAAVEAAGAGPAP